MHKAKNELIKALVIFNLLMIGCKSHSQVDTLSWDFVMSKEWQVPEKLGTLNGTHPRLFLSAVRIESLKVQIRSSHRHMWDRIQQMADDYAKAPIDFDYNKEGDMRRAGRGIPWQALAFLLTDRPVYLESAKKWVLTISSYPRWENNKSLAAGECLFGVAIGYDWLYDHFTPEEREIIREKLKKQANLLVDGPPQHHDRWLANHNHVEHLGLAAAGFALYDKVNKARDWIRQADLVFDTFFSVAARDGSSSEGHQYWAYTTESVLRYTELARDLMGKNYYDSEWLMNVPYFIIFSTLPDFASSNCVMYFGDAHRGYRSHGPTHILYRVADEYNNGYAQWLAKEMDKREIGKNDYCTWLNLLWYNKEVAPVSLTHLPTFKHFDDIGWITSRSSWEDDAILIGFKNGPVHGHKVQPYYDRQYEQNWNPVHEIGGGHGHPDVNSFQIYAYGEWLAIDPEYEKPKWTRTHNTILVNGKGQVGEGQDWFDRKSAIRSNAKSEIIKVINDPEFDYIIGDASNVYPDSLGLEKYYRHLLYLKPNIILIVDELQAKEPARFEWRLNTEGKLEKKGENAFLVKQHNVVMDGQILLPQSITLEIKDQMIKVFPEKGKKARVVAILEPRKIDERQSRIIAEEMPDNKIRLKLDNRKTRKVISLDLQNQAIQISPAGLHQD